MLRRSFVPGLVLALPLILPAFGRAELSCEQPVHQAGQVRNGLPLTHQFTFVNRGILPVEITDVRSSCGCLTPRLPARTIPPGERGTVLVEINTLTLAEGTQTWRTTLAYRDGITTGGLELIVVGDVTTEVLVQPAALTLPADAPGTHAITVTDRRNKPLTVRAADAGSPCLRLSVGGTQQENGAAVQRVRLEVPADCPEGRHDIAVHLYTDDPLYREFKVPVTVVKRAKTAVAAMPARLVFDGERGQAFASRLVRLAAADEREVEIERVESGNEAVRCTWSKGATVRVQVEGSRLNGDLTTTLRVHLLKPVAETVVIPVTIVVR